jgi:hypothetical protein
MAFYLPYREVINYRIFFAYHPSYLLISGSKNYLSELYILCCIIVQLSSLETIIIKLVAATRSLQFEDRKHDLRHSKYKFNSYENEEKPLSIVNTHFN